MGIVIPTILWGLAFCYFENNSLVSTKIEMKLDVKEDFRILHISDLHSKSFGKDNKRLLKSILDNNPDIIITTGDLIDSSTKNMYKIIDFLAELNRRVAVVYIPGNNEMRCGKLDEIVLRLKKRGVSTLNNEMVDINIKSNEVSILGLVETIEKKSSYITAKAKDTYSYKGYRELFKKLEEKKGLKLVLSHYPENFDSREDIRYSKYNFDIMFSGHAHGGQFILPFIGGLFAPGQGILPKYYKGVHGEKNKLVISRGLGNSGFPLRLFNRPEIVIVDIMK